MPLNLVTDKEYDACNQILRKLPDIEKALDQCEACGLETGDRRDRCKMLREFAEKIKAEFFADRP